VARLMLTMVDRAQIAAGVTSGLGDREIGEPIDRHHTVIWRERTSWRAPPARRPCLTNDEWRRVCHP